MQKLVIFFVILSILSFTQIFAANNGSISGIIFDSSNRDPIVGANVVISDSKIGCAADLNGYFIITLVPAGEYLLKITAVGYEPVEIRAIVLPGVEEKLEISMKSVAIEAPEIVIAAERIVEGASVSDAALTTRMFRSKDGLMEDPIKVLQTMPGIVSMNDPFTPGQLYVRGGAPEENLFLLDWARVYFPWYLGGVKSIFNSKTIDKIELLTGGFPPKYGNALSSVLSVNTRDGNYERYSGGLSLGVMTSQGLIEGPISEKSSFLMTTRRTYLDLLMGDNEDYPVPSFFDGCIKLSYRLNPVHSLSFSAFASNESQDFYNPDPDPGIPSRLKMSMINNTQSLELNSLFSKKVYSKLVVMRSYVNSGVIGGTIYDVDSGIEIIGMREDMTYKPNEQHEYKAGIEFNYFNYHINNLMPIDPSDTYTTYDSSGVPMDHYLFSKNYNTAGAYIQDSYNIVKPLTITGGFRIDNNFWTEKTDVSPRLSARYDYSPSMAFRAAWGIYRMFDDPMFTYRNPDLNSQQAVHYIVGLTQSFGQTYAGWIELFYKDYSNIVRADSSGAFFDSGEGFSQGIELFFQKKLGAVSGWVTLSLSEAKRQEYLDVKEFYFDYDQRVMSTLVMEYNLPQPTRYLPDIIGLNFRFATGRPYTPVVSAYEDLTTGEYIPVKGETNSERFDDFHALSLRAEWRFKMTESINSKIYLEGWNLYNRKNPQGVDYRYGNQYADTNNVKERFYYSTPLLIAGGIGIEF